MGSGPQEQRQIVAWILATATVIGAITYFLELIDFTRGLAFGVLLTLVNYWVIGLIFNFTFRRVSNGAAKVLSFVGYQVRFLILVFILFLVIPKSPYWFSVGTFVGVLLPKTVMGIHLLRTKDDEWWNNKSIVPEKGATGNSVSVDKDTGSQLPQDCGYDDSQENPNIIA